MPPLPHAKILNKKWSILNRTFKKFWRGHNTLPRPLRRWEGTPRRLRRVKTRAFAPPLPSLHKILNLCVLMRDLDSRARLGWCCRVDAAVVRSCRPSRRCPVDSCEEDHTLESVVNPPLDGEPPGQ